MAVLGPMRTGRLVSRCVVEAVLLAAIVPAASAAPASAAGCHPGPHVLARADGVVLWSSQGKVAGKVRTRIYACASSRGGAELVISGGGTQFYNHLAPSVKNLEVAGHFAAFFLKTTDHEGYRDTSLVVFDLGRARIEVNIYLYCSGGPTEACGLEPSSLISAFALAPNGWVAAARSDEGGYPDYSSSYEYLVATEDGKHVYPVDYGTISALGVSGSALRWTNELGGASSAQLGPDLVPAATPQTLTSCDVITAADLTPVLGASTSSSASGQCTYTSTSDPAMTLTVGVQTGLTPAQQTAYEDALSSAGWNSVSAGYEKSTIRSGVTHDQLYAFTNGVQLSLDLTVPGANSSEQLGWLTGVAFDRLFGIQVQRAQ